MSESSSSTPAISSARSSTRAGSNWLLLLILCAICLMAVSSRSLWIDEGSTTNAILQPSFQGFWKEMRAMKGSELQAPLYFIWMWACEKVVGSSERALRALNLVWFVPGLLVLLRALSRKPALQWAAFLAVVFNSFAWYYLDEARPYAMQLGISLFVFGVLCQWVLDPAPERVSERRRVWISAAALILLCLSNLLGMIWAVAPVGMLLAILPWQRLRALALTYAGIWIGVLGLLFCLGIYYLWTLHTGARGTELAPMSWKNPFFIAYEMAGFGGLGPARADIRDIGFPAFGKYWIVLGLFGVALGILLWLAGQDLLKKLGPGKCAGLAVMVCIPATFIFGAGVVMHWRVLERACAPAAPVLWLILAVGMVAAWRWGLAGRVVVIVFFLLYAASALSLRFAVRHQRDDYRGAVRLAKAELAQGRTIWWNANTYTAEYYDLPLSTRPGDSGKALWIANPTPEMIAADGQPDVIIASRRDVFDAQGELSRFLEESHYKMAGKLPSFVIWKRATN